MKDLYESILSGTKAVIDRADENFKKEIIDWILKNYRVNESDIKVSNKPYSDGLYRVNINGDIRIFNKNITLLTNGVFKFGRVKGRFGCDYCAKLTSLKGAPEKVDRSFYCMNCDSLTTLEGAPSVVKECFNCGVCGKITSLKGAPKKAESFICSICGGLTTLEGAPEKVDESFECTYCDGLTSLKGAPKVVGKDFVCARCNKLITLEGAPMKVGREFDCSGCKNLKDYSELDKIKIGEKIRK